MGLLDEILLRAKDWPDSVTGVILPIVQDRAPTGMQRRDGLDVLACAPGTRHRPERPQVTGDHDEWTTT